MWTSVQFMTRIFVVNYSSPAPRTYVISAVSLSAVLLKKSLAIFLKLDVMTGPTNRKNRITYGKDPVPDTDSESLFYSPHHCRRGYFRRFISISYRHDTCQNDQHWQENEIHCMLGTIRHSDPDWYGNADSNARSHLLEILALVEVYALWAVSGLLFWSS